MHGLMKFRYARATLSYEEAREAIDSTEPADWVITRMRQDVADLRRTYLAGFTTDQIILVGRLVVQRRSRALSRDLGLG